MEDKNNIALEWMRKMEMMNECVEAFKKGKLWQSEGAGFMSGILYEASEEVLHKAKEIEEKTGQLVWHVIRGVYLVSGDKVKMDTYLLVEEGETFEHENETYCCYAYVDNKTYPMDSEYGSVLITNANGGLKRVG